MRRHPVESSTFRTLGYDAEVQVMEAEFASGEVYRYVRFPRRVWAAFMAATSKGRFFAGHIRRQVSVPAGGRKRMNPGGIYKWTEG